MTSTNTRVDTVVKGFIAGALAQLGEYQGPWTAPWLRGKAIGVATWSLVTRRSRKVGNEIVGDTILRWNFLLPDGTYLDSPENSYIQETAQKIAFLVRTLPAWNIRAASTHQTFVTNLHFVIRWLFEFKEIYNPQKYAFCLLDKAGIDCMLGEYLQGGSLWALHVPQKLLSKLCSLLTPPGDPSLIKNIFEVPVPLKQSIISWLRNNDFYDRTPVRGTVTVSLNRGRLSELVGLDHKQLNTPKFSALLRQFEPELSEAGGPLLIMVNSPRTEFISHRTQLICEVQGSKCSTGKLNTLIGALDIIFRLHRKIPKGCPKNAVDFASYYKWAEQEGAPEDNTPLIPIDVAVRYASESIRWVIQYAKPVVDFYLAAAAYFVATGDINDKPADSGKAEKRARRNKWIEANLPSELKALNISRWGTVFHHGNTPLPHEHLRSAPGLHDVIDILVGATLYLLIETCDLREGEVVALRVDDLLIQEKDGYWLRRGQEKAHLLDEPSKKKRPCPGIVARALLEIVRLRDGLQVLKPSSDPYERSSLFYIPDSAHNAGLTAAALNRLSLSRCLEAFCDYVAAPVDELGRRWYVRPHECRKSCLVTFFSCTGFAALDTARWMAGHKSLHSIFVYLKKNTPRDRFLAMEASLASSELWRIELEQSPTVRNAPSLYENVCARFGVSSIAAIAREELDSWLKDAFAHKLYALEIKSDDGTLREEIAFLIGE
ncbi:hypothetical protein [Paraburkholderia sp. BR13444]|uniref:hypothetical protein n=1 Tax=Paraburkholderia sp. BR13444 TaxID=3236997 RepID=UPI0034CD1FE1